MKKRNLLKIAALSALGILSVENVYAQEPLKESIAGNLGGTRFVITAPASISGIKKINYANWGAAASPTISGMSIEKAYDTLGAAALLNGTAPYPSLTGKFALIFRGGGITFSDKVNRCITAGAAGVIIVNNVPGDPVGMAPTPAGSTVSVPVLMISDVDGQAISDLLKAGTGVTLTLGTWNTGGTHDLGLMLNYQAAPHALNTPLHQLVGSAGSNPFKHYIGGAVANYGSTTETTVAVTDSVYFIPSGGSASSVATNTYTIPSISVADSIKFGFGSGTYELPAPTAVGHYEHRYSISYGNPDDFPQDNRAVLNQYVTDSVYCKGRYDFTNVRPFVSLGIRPGAATPINFTMGNLFYIKNGGYAARRLQFSMSHDTNPTLDGFSANAFICKWVDGTGGGDKDSVIQAGELTVVGASNKILTTADTSGRTITVPVLDINTGLPKTIILDGDSWYFIAVDVPAPLFIGIDESMSFFTRSFAQWRNAGSVPGKLVDETSTGLYTADFTTFTSAITNSAAPYPFAGNAFYIDSVFYDRFNEIPSVALLMSKDKPTGSVNQQMVNQLGETNIFPNPAQNGKFTVQVALDKTYNKVVYRLADVMGRTVYTETHQNVQNEQFEVNTSQLASGVYYFMVATESGLISKKVTIQN